MLKNSQLKIEQYRALSVGKGSLLVTGCLLLNACSFFSQPEELDTEILEPIKVPGKVSSAKFEELMIIPQQPDSPLPAVSENPVPRPKPLQGLQTVSNTPESGSNAAAGTSVLRSAEIAKDGNGSPVLRMDVGFGYAWPMVRAALQKTSLNLVDFNRSLATFYIEVDDPDQGQEEVSEDGIFKRLFGGDEEDNSALPLQIKVNEAHSGVYLSVQRDSESLASDDISQKILSMIQQELDVAS